MARRYPRAYRAVALDGRAAQAFVDRWNRLRPYTGWAAHRVEVWARPGAYYYQVLVYLAGCVRGSFQVPVDQFRRVWPYLPLLPPRRDA